MLDMLLEDLRKKQDQILEESQPVKILLELSDPKRLERAGEILKSNRITISQLTGSLVQGSCPPYEVSFQIRGGKVRECSCTCYDHQKNHETRCKHVLALGALWLLTQKQIWVKLGEAAEILNPEKKTQAA